MLIEKGARRLGSRRPEVISLRPGIERATELMRWVIADSVLAEAGRFLGA
jgi:hypothetical protein